jgi:small GTP-binding protein
MRVLMTHGGRAVREAVAGYLREAGFRDGAEGGGAVAAAYEDVVYDPLLASCITEAQAAAVLDARRLGRPVPPEALATRRIVLAGAPNAGKSSLFNQLAGYDRAFVHEESGATRDVVDELIDLGGYAALLGDLPGYRRGEEGVGKAAWALAARAARDADCVLFVADGSKEWDGETASAAEEVARLLRTTGAGRAAPVLVVLNKADLPAKLAENAWKACFPEAGAVRVCSLEGGGARETIVRALKKLCPNPP